jgi:hypothetical protein
MDILALTRGKNLDTSAPRARKAGYFRASREIHLDILALRAALFVFFRAPGYFSAALYFTSL